MRSFWRMMAARWLGGEPSAALTSDSALLDMVMQPSPRRPTGFVVSRQSEASANALLARHVDIAPQPQLPAASTVLTDGEI